MTDTASARDVIAEALHHAERFTASDGHPTFRILGDEEAAGIALAALADAGFVVVPREPSDAMVDAATEAWGRMPPLSITDILRAALGVKEER